MRLTINQSDLSTHLEKVKPIIPNRPTHPILGNFVLEATEGKLTISAFNLSLGVKTSLVAEVEKPGTITVPAKLFSGLIASLPNQALVLSTEAIDFNNDWTTEVVAEGIFFIQGNDSKYQVSFLGVDNYPDIPSVAESYSKSIKIKTFIELLNPVLSSYTNDETKQVLLGVHFSTQDNTLELASTDGHRLSVTSSNLETANNKLIDPIDLIIPGAALEYVIKNIKELDLESSLEFKGNNELVKFSFAETEITTRLLQGAYPNYNELIPPQFKDQITFIGSDMIEAIKRLLLFNPDKNIIVIEANKNLQTLTVTTLDTKVGKGSETIHAELNLNFKMGFNGKYLIEAIKALETKSLTLNINTPKSPAVLIPCESTLNRSLVLVMPIQIAESDMYVETLEIQDIPVSPEDIETSETQKLSESIPNSLVEENPPMNKKKTTKKKKPVAVA